MAMEIRRKIAAGIGCDLDSVNVKGKTNDGFGPEGQGQAISATVLVQLGVDDATMRSVASDASRQAR